LATNLYQFALGLATELVGGATIDSCLPPAWKNANQPEEGDMDTNVAQQKTTWEKIGSVIGTAINVVCAAKDIVMKVIEFFTSDAKRRIRRYIRLFLQGKITSTFKMRWSIGGFFKSAGNAIAGAAQTVTTKASQAYQTVKKGAAVASEWVGKEVGKVADAIKDALSAIFEKVINFFNEMKVKVVAFFNSPLMKNIMAFIKCVKALKEAAGNIATLIQGFVDKAADIANFPLGWIKIIVGLICAWEDLRDAINYLTSGFNEKDPLKKWNFYGKFTGKLVYVIGTS
jgi:hypothetical protein